MHFYLFLIKIVHNGWRISKKQNPGEKVENTELNENKPLKASDCGGLAGCFTEPQGIAAIIAALAVVALIPLMEAAPFFAGLMGVPVAQSVVGIVFVVVGTAFVLFTIAMIARMCLCKPTV